MERLADGTSFAEAVRSALVESIESGVDDEGQEDEETSEINGRKTTIRKREKTEKLLPKEKRKRMRELRRIRRSERIRKHAMNINNKHQCDNAMVIKNCSITHQQQLPHQTQQDSSSESQIENLNGRPIHHCDNRTRRRRRERNSATRRKRSEWSSTSDSDNYFPERYRRRLR